jgi:hypothetical protein
MNRDNGDDDGDEVPLLDTTGSRADALNSLRLSATKKSRCQCACTRWCQRHPRVRGCGIALGVLCTVVLLCVGVLGFLLYGAVDAQLDQTRLLVQIDDETLCSAGDTGHLRLSIVHAVIQNPCVVPIAVNGGRFHVSLLANSTGDAGGSNELLASGAVPAFGLHYGAVWLNGTELPIALSVSPNRVGRLLARLFRDEPLSVLVEADVQVSVFGIPLPLPTVTKTITVGGHDDGASGDKRNDLRWHSVALVESSDERLRVDVTLSTLLRLPMLRVIAPASIVVDVMRGSDFIATVTPPNATTWVFERGWVTLSSVVVVPRNATAAVGSFANDFMHNVPFNATLVGSATAASFRTCWAQQVLAATPLFVNGQSTTDASTPSAKLGQLHVLSADAQTLLLDVGLALKHEFDTNSSEANATADGRIHLVGAVPTFVVNVDARAAPFADPLSMDAPERFLFGTVVGHGWQLSDGPRGLLSVTVTNASNAAVAVDALALHERNLWLDVDTDVAADANDTLSRIIDELSFTIPFLVNASSTAPKTSAVLLSQLRIHVNDFSDARRVCADVTTSLNGSTFAADALDLRVNLTNIEAELHRVETNEFVGELVVERLSAAGSNISLLVCSRNLQADVLARIATDTISDAASITIVGRGLAQLRSNASVVTRVLQSLSYTKVFVDAPRPGVPPSKHLLLKSVQSGGGRGTVAHVLVRYQMRGNLYIDLDAPNLMLMAAAGPNNRFLSIRVLPFALLRGNATQELEVLLDIDNVTRVGYIVDEVLNGTEIPWQLAGAPLSALTSRIRQYGSGTPRAARDTALSPILNAWSYSVVLDKPKSPTVQGDGAVLPLFDLALRPGSTRRVLKLRLGLNLTIPDSFLELVIGNMSASFAAPGAPRREFLVAQTENPIVLRPGLNMLGFLVDVHADPADGTLQALQRAVYNIVSTPAPVSVALVGSVQPISSPGGIDPQHEPPFSIYYDFVLPRGGAGNGTSVILCQDNPVVHIDYNITKGQCAVDIQMKVWFRNPVGIPIKISQLAFTLEFDDPDGAFKLLYPSPKYNIVLGVEDERNLTFALPSYGVSPLNVVAKHPANDPNGWYETCIRAASQYYVDNTLVVRLQDGAATVMVDDVFTLQLVFANVSFAVDKNVRLNNSCENILIAQGIIPRPSLF